MTSSPSEAIAIGASAGALEALSIILPSLPPDFALPIFVVVHVPPDKKSILAQLFQAKCRIRVREVEDKEPIAPGTAYFATADQTLSLSNEEPVLYSRPSIDVLFETAADAYGPGLVAIVLTGANQDGAKGLAAVVRAGGSAIVQTPEGAYAAAMPEAAIAAAPNARILTLDEISLYLQGLEKA